MKYGSFLITILIMLNSVSASSSDIQDLLLMKNAAREYVVANIHDNSNSSRHSEVIIGELDPRLRLRSCAEDLIGIYSTWEQFKRQYNSWSQM